MNFGDSLVCREKGGFSFEDQALVIDGLGNGEVFKFKKRAWPIRMFLKIKEIAIKIYRRINGRKL